jgi:hypothetical protein
VGALAHRRRALTGTRPVWAIKKRSRNLNAYKTYCAITVSDRARLRTLAVMVYRKPLRKGGICWLYLISFEGQQSTLGMTPSEM